MTKRTRFYFSWKKHLKGLQFNLHDPEYQQFEGIIPYLERIKNEGIEWPVYNPSSADLLKEMLRCADKMDKEMPPKEYY